MIRSIFGIDMDKYVGVDTTAVDAVAKLTPDMDVWLFDDKGNPIEETNLDDFGPYRIRVPRISFDNYGGDLDPANDDAQEIGKPLKRWAKGHFSQSISVGNQELTPEMIRDIGNSIDETFPPGKPDIVPTNPSVGEELAVLTYNQIASNSAYEVLYKLMYPTRIPTKPTITVSGVPTYAKFGVTNNSMLNAIVTYQNNGTEDIDAQGLVDTDPYELTIADGTVSRGSNSTIFISHNHKVATQVYKFRAFFKGSLVNVDGSPVNDDGVTAYVTKTVQNKMYTHYGEITGGSDFTISPTDRAANSTKVFGLSSESAAQKNTFGPTISAGKDLMICVPFFISGLTLIALGSEVDNTGNAAYELITQVGLLNDYGGNDSPNAYSVVRVKGGIADKTYDSITLKF